MLSINFSLHNKKTVSKGNVMLVYAMMSNQLVLVFSGKPKNIFGLKKIRKAKIIVGTKTG
jgi:accessory colonization factor AcfC